MYDVLQTTLQKHQGTWSNNQAMVTGVEKFKALFAELKTLSHEHELVLAGINSERKAYMSELIAKTMELRSALVVLAFETDNYSMLESLHFSEAKLQKVGQLALRLHITTVMNYTSQFEAELPSYGINTEKIQGFISLYSDFDSKVARSRQGLVERKFVTQRIKDLELELKTLMKNKLDILVRLFKIESPAFFSDYKNARIVIEQTQSRAKTPPDEDIGIAS